jgi:hypothetical protein
MTSSVEMLINLLQGRNSVLYQIGPLIEHIMITSYVAFLYYLAIAQCSRFEEHIFLWQNTIFLTLYGLFNGFCLICLIYR